MDWGLRWEEQGGGYDVDIPVRSAEKKGRLVSGI